MRGEPDPYTPPVAVASRDERDPRTPSSWPDLLLTLVSWFMLLPAMLINGVLWVEHGARLGIFDPAFGGGPGWQQRPLLVPLLVSAVALGRLGLARVRFVQPGYRWALLIVAAVAAFLAIVSRIPEQAFPWGP